MAAVLLYLKPNKPKTNFLRFSRTNSKLANVGMVVSLQHAPMMFLQQEPKVIFDLGS